MPLRYPLAARGIGGAAAPAAESVRIFVHLGSQFIWQSPILRLFRLQRRQVSAKACDKATRQVNWLSPCGQGLCRVARIDWSLLPRRAPASPMPMTSVLLSTAVPPSRVTLLDLHDQR